MTLFRVSVSSDQFFILQAETPEAACAAARSLPAYSPLAATTELRAEPIESRHWAIGVLFQGPLMNSDGKGRYVCVAYDWRTGFWMKDTETGVMRDVSERAIGRTYHEVRT